MDNEQMTKLIMERAKRRRDELGESENKENSPSFSVDSAVYSDSPAADRNTLKSPNMSWKNSSSEGVRIRETNIDGDLNHSESGGKRRSAFADLAAEYDNFTDDTTTWEKPKEAYIKGRQQRLSIGENRAPSKSPVRSSSRNASPAKSLAKSPAMLPPVEEQEERRIRFAQPICATSVFEVESSYSTTMTTTSNDSSIVAGNMHYTSSLSTEVSTSSTSDDVTSSDVYGAHTFIRKKTPSTSSLCSPQPFNRDGLNASFSSVHFNPTATSSPKLEESTVTIVMDKPVTAEITLQTPENSTMRRADESKSKLQEPGQGNTPKSSTTGVGGTAKAMAQQLENKMRNTTTHPPLPVSIKKTSTTTTPAVKTTPSEKSEVKTQWRGAAGTPVVVGADPSEPTKPDARAANIKSLRSRWEFSSLTGTPLHPDETEDALLRAAIRMRDTTIPRKERVQVTPKATSSHSQSHSAVSSEKKTAVDRSATTSPVHKSPRYERKETPKKESTAKEELEIEEIHEPEVLEESSFSDNELSEDELQLQQAVEEQGNISKFIDDAFDFMGKSPAQGLDKTETVTPNRAPLATVEDTPAILRQPDTPASAETSSMYDCRPPESSTNTPSGSGLHYTISYYRKRAREQRNVDHGAEKINLSAVTPSAPQQFIGLDESSTDEGILLEKKKDELEKLIFAQKTRIPQASKALQLCRERAVLRESPEEAEAQLRVLVETERYRAATAELDRLNKQNTLGASGPKGQIIVTSIQVNLRRDFLQSLHRDTRSIYYFSVLFKLGEHVFATKNVSSDHADSSKGVISFQGCAEAPLFALDDISPNFVAYMEVYFYRTQRGQYSHEQKYNLESGSTKKTLSRQSGRIISTGTSSLVADSAYQLAGRLTLDITTPSGKSAFMLTNIAHPIEGGITVSMKKRSQDSSDTSYSGFLSMFQRTREGLGSWNRYYCVLESGEMKFWRSPEDATGEGNKDKKWLVLLDLRTCASDGASTVREVCPYPNSFHIDVWVPKSPREVQGSIDRRERGDMEKLRVMMAADTKSDMNVWLDNINRTVRQLLLWRRPMQ